MLREIRRRGAQIGVCGDLGNSFFVDEYLDEGSVDLNQCLDILRESGYNGVISLDFEEKDAQLSQALLFLRQLQG